MSLINDALKKAARQRSQSADLLPPVPGGGPRPSRQGAPMKTQTLVLLMVAALILVAGSAVVTGYILRSKETPAAPAPKIAAKPAPTPAPSPVAASAAITPPAAPAKPVVIVMAPTPTPAPSPVAVVAAPVVVASPSPAPAAAVSAAQAASHLDQVQAIVERYRVSGVRMSSSGSKALIDGHIYKLNDVIEKSIGLTLVGIDTDHLTFRDRDGQTYVKNL